MRNLSHYGVTMVLLLLTSNFSSAQPEPFRIAVLGCHRQFEPAPALFRYIEAEPDLCLWIGDNIYADTEDDITFIDSCYQALASKPAFKEIMAKFPYMATWDDHDFGLNDAGKDYPLKQESKALFRKFWRLEAEIPAEQEGIYYSKMFPYQDKDIQVIMLDVRYNRDAPGTNGDILGAVQWKWLEETLGQPADVRIIVSGFQILLDQEAGSETWDNFPDSRTRLFDLIRRQQQEQVFFLTGDQHYGEVCRQDQALDFDAVELQFAGINQIEKPEFNPARVSNVITSKHSYALLDLYLDSTEFDVPHLAFQIFDGLTNQRELYYRVALAELRFKELLPPNRFFVDQTTIFLQNPYSRLQLRYTLDGSTPTKTSRLYTSPIELHTSTEVKLRFFDPQGWARSSVQSGYFQKVASKPAVKATNIKKGLKYRYYEGDFADIPEFSNLEPVDEGLVASFELDEVAKRKDHYAVLYEGLVKVPTSGVYTFYTYSDDGSRLFIDQQEVVNNAGSHSARKRSGVIPLQAGLHHLKLAYFEDYGGEILKVGFKVDNESEQLIKPEQLFHK
jgi:alkaline phosphatase D